MEAQKNLNEDEEISLIDLFAVLWQYKKLIIGITFFGAVFAIVFSIISLVLPPEHSPYPNKYTPKATMLIKDESSSASSGLLSMVASSGLGGFLGGMTGNSSNASLAQYLIHSDSFLDSVADKFNLIEKWEIEKSPKANSRKQLKKVLLGSYDDESGVFTISFKDIDPIFARDIVNFCVDRLEQYFYDLGVDSNQLEKKNLEENIKESYQEINRLQKEIHKVENSVSYGYSSSGIQSIALDATMLQLELSAQEQIYKQLKTQYELVKIDLASKTPVFQILEKAEIPDLKSEPSRAMLCIVITFASFFVAVFIAFLKNAIKNVKNDKVAMAKLRGNNA